MALTLLALVATALAVIGARMRADFVRTHDAAVDAQLRQLLLAGAADAAHRAVGWGERPEPAKWSLDLPQPLADGANVRAAASPARQAVEVHLSAECYGRRAGQTLRFERQGATWQLTETVADGPAVPVR